MYSTFLTTYCTEFLTVCTIAVWKITLQTLSILHDDGFAFTEQFSVCLSPSFGKLSFHFQLLWLTYFRYIT